MQWKHEIDLMLYPQNASSVARELPGLRKRLPQGTRIALGVLYRSGRETGAHLFARRAELEEALDRVASTCTAQRRQPSRHGLSSPVNSSADASPRQRRLQAL